MLKCRWCGRDIVDDGGRPQKSCPHCGHRASLPRPICDCSICWARRARGEMVDWTDRDRAQLTAYAADRIALMVTRALGSSPSVTASRRLGLLKFEDWAKRYRRNVNADPVMHRSFRALAALGVDVDTILRRGYEAGRSAERPV
jgi:hypothetical protein